MSVQLLLKLSQRLRNFLTKIFALLKNNKRGIALAAILLLSGYLYNQRLGIRKAQLQFYAKQTAFNYRVIHLLKENSAKDALHPLLHNRHIQTVIPQITAHFRNKQKHWNLHFKRTYVPLKDGGVKGLDVAIDGVLDAEKPITSVQMNDQLHLLQNGQSSASKPMIIVVPGLTSGIEETYIVKMARQALDAGYQCIIIHHRGCSQTKLGSPRTYSAAGTSDLQECLDFLQEEMAQQNARVPIFAVGFSMGANILMKYLGEKGKCTPIAAACSVHNAYNFILCSQNIPKQLFGIYDRVLAQSLQLKVKRNYEALKAIEETTTVRFSDVFSSKVRSVRTFDEYYTRRLFNYETTYQYYRDASCDRFLMRVKVPTLLMDSRDDPITPENAIPYEECLKNENLVLGVTEGGGHLGCLNQNYEMLYQKHVTAYFDLFEAK